MTKKMTYHELKERGLITHEGGGTLDEILAGRRKVYLGVDPTADSLHVGNLVPIILVKHLFDLGHEPFLLVGGATGMIGDPRESGERSMLEAMVLRKNTLAIKKQLALILKKKELRVFDNSQWLGKLNLITFLREVGKNFSVNQLIKRDIIKRRLETEEDSISYTEFSYSLLQAYDFFHLFQKHGVNLQVGGSDQWANIISGIDLIRRKTGKAAFALTTPMVVDKVTGKKFGKSEGNAVWLDPKKTSPFTFYQFWLNVSDENIENYLKIFSFLPLVKISEILQTHQAKPHARIAQKMLAKEITAFVHGLPAAKSVEKISDILYGSDTIPKLLADEKKLILSEVENQKLSKQQIKAGVSVVEILCMLNLAKSKTEARNLIQGNGIKVNGINVVSTDSVVNESDVHNGLIFIRKAKKFALLVI
jgi:tyrosyl-tRNA synthetase